MNKFTIPAILVVTVLVAGIFAFMPVEKASTVHTTLQSATQADTQTTTIQNTQLNNIKNTFQTDLGADRAAGTGNATASCGTSGGGFLVYWTFTNTTRDLGGTSDTGVVQGLGISNGTGRAADIVVGLKNQTAISGVMGGTNGATIVFFGNSSSGTGGTLSFEDTGDLAITVVCRSGSTAATTP